jgi:hypothetical protein
MNNMIDMIDQYTGYALAAMLVFVIVASMFMDYSNKKSKKD